MKKTTIIILIMLSLLLIFSGCDQDKKDEKKTATPVMIYTVTPDNISRYIKLTGGLEADVDLDLYSMTSEKIKRILVTEGQSVKKGALLLEQENEMFLQGVKLAEAAVNSAAAQAELAEKDFKRMQSLLKDEAITQQQFDQVEMQYRAAQAGLQLANAQHEQAKQQLAYSRIFAPSDGKIAMIYFRKNQMLPAGVPVIKLVNTQKMIARILAPEIDMNSIHVDQEVIAHFSPYPDEDFKGKVTSIDSANDPMTRTVELEVLLDNGTDKLRSGLFGEFLLVTDHRDNTIVLSDQAIMTRTKLRIDKDGKQITDKEYYVFLEIDKKAVMQTIETGLHSRGRLEITAGLNFGDRVIVVGQNIVKDGDEVRLAN